MSHYEIDYTKMTEAEAHTRSIKDIKEWLGGKRYKMIVDLFEASKLIDEPFTKSDADKSLFILGMQGIQGYPARVFIMLHTNCPKDILFS